MAKLDEMFPRSLLTVTDLPKPTVVTLQKIFQEDVRSPRGVERKWLASFRNCRKRLVLCRESSEQLAQIAGSTESSDWEGLTVELFVDSGVQSPHGNGGLRFRKPQQAAPSNGSRHRDMTEDDLDRSSAGAGRMTT